MSDEAPQSNSDIQLELARVRTALALDRTLLAWVRTSISLTAFGFTIAKFLHLLVDNGTLKATHAHAPRNLGLTIMFLGVLCLIGGAAEQYRFAKKLNNMPTWTVAMILTILLTLMSVILMVGLYKDTSH